MCKGDDQACAEFEKHRLELQAGLAKERRAFLKSSFAATGGAAALATAGISLVSPALAQSSAARQPGQPSYHHLPANADTVHWGYFSKLLKPQVEVESGDFVTIETLTHQASDDAERMITGDAGAESVYLWTKDKKGIMRRGAGTGDGGGLGVHICTGPVAVRSAQRAAGRRASLNNSRGLAGMVQAVDPA